MKTLFIGVWISFTALASAQASLDSVALEIAHNELLFSYSSVIKGRNQAFIEFLADSSIAFHPLPVNAKELYKNLADKKYYLSWKPTVVEVSSSGDFGLSSGPWEIRSSRLSDIPDLVGYFVSIWEKNGSGWKVIFDHGIGYPIKEVRQEIFQHLLPTSSIVKSIDKEKENRNVIAVEYQFLQYASDENQIAAYKKYSAENIRLYRQDRFPVTGRQASFNEIAKDKKQDSFQLFNSKISNGGDLAFVYGIAISGADTSNYFRLWRKESEWKIALDMMNTIHSP